MAFGRNNIFISRDVGDKSKQIQIASGETKYSDQINVSSDKDFARVGFRITRTGTLDIAIYVQYTMPGYSEYTDGVKLGDAKGSLTKMHFYRLDALLGPNWMPNTPMRFKFVASGGGSGTIEGIYSV